MIHAIYQDGVFRPTSPVDLPEGSEVTIQPKPADKPTKLSVHQQRIYAILSNRYDDGPTDGAAHHDEHQP